MLKHVLILALFLALTACAGDEDKTEKASSDTPSTTGDNASPAENSPWVEAVTVMIGPEEAQDKAKPVLPPVSPEELAKADKIVDFSNRARHSLTSGFYSMPDALLDNAQKYMETWHLNARPRLPARKNAARNLVPPSGIFDEAEEKQMTGALQEMDSALDRMLSHYADLEKYVADTSIHDDGKKGRELASELATGHEQFMKARKTWLEIVEARADEAEEKLLRDHPLQRQILAARNIFAQMREVAELLGASAANAATLEPIRQNLNSIIDYAGKPPFTASPALERLYREFLKQAAAYDRILQVAIVEGFFGYHKRELNVAAMNCRKAYNDFARAANALASKS